MHFNSVKGLAYNVLIFFITFNLECNAQSIVDTLIIERDSSFIVRAHNEIAPMFPGGDIGLIRYLKSHKNYPKTASNDRLEGKVYLKLTITETGQVANIMVVKGVREGLDNEARRLVENMPRWKPGTQNGVPISTGLYLPIAFQFKRK